MKSNYFFNITPFIKKIIGIGIILIYILQNLSIFAQSEFEQFANKLADAGIINAQTDESGYRLNDTITRAEMAKIAVRIAGGSTSECSGDMYADVSSKLGDLCGFIEAAADMGIVSISNTMFRPSDPITRAEMVKMLLSSQGIIPESSTTSVFSDVSESLGDLALYINTAVESGIIDVTDIFRPNDNTTRGEVFKVAQIVMALGTGMTSTGTTGTGTNTGSTGTGGTTGTGTTATGSIGTGSTGTGSINTGATNTGSFGVTQENISIQNFAFVPGTITVKKGSTITWKNQDTVGHTVTFDSFGSILLNQGDTYTHTFNSAGTFPYICTPHPNMTGTVLVTE